MMTKVSARVDLKEPKFYISSSTIRAVNDAADKICKLMPKARPHKLSEVCYEFRREVMHQRYVVRVSRKTEYQIEWHKLGALPWYKGSFKKYLAPDREPELITEDVAILSLTGPMALCRLLSTPFCQGILSDRQDFTKGWSLMDQLTTSIYEIEDVRQFVRAVKSGKLVKELKKAIALEEAKEAAEVKLFYRSQKAHLDEEAKLAAVLA